MKLHHFKSTLRFLVFLEILGLWLPIQTQPSPLKGPEFPVFCETTGLLNKEELFLKNLESSLSNLVDLYLPSSNSRVRQMALWSMGQNVTSGKMTGKYSDVLKKNLFDSDVWVQIQAIRTISIFVGNEILPKKNQSSLISLFLQLYRQNNPFLKAEILQGFWDFEQTGQIKEVSFVASKDPVWLVRRYGNDNSIKGVLEKLTDEDPYIRYGGMRIVGNEKLYENPSVRLHILNLLFDPVERTVIDTLTFLENQKANDAVPIILQLIPTKLGALAKVTAQNISGKTEEELLQEFQTKGLQTSFTPIQIKSKSPEEINRLRNTIQSNTSPTQKAQALLQLAWMESSELLIILKDTIYDSHPLIRWTSWEILKARQFIYRDEAALGPYLGDLLVALHDDNPSVVQAVLDLTGLWLMDIPQTQSTPTQIYDQVQAIVEIARCHSDGMLRSRAMSILGSLKKYLPADFYEKFLGDPFYLVQIYALQQLDPRKIPETIEVYEKLLEHPSRKVKMSVLGLVSYWKNEVEMPLPEKLLEKLNESPGDPVIR